MAKNFHHWVEHWGSKFTVLNAFLETWDSLKKMIGSKFRTYFFPKWWVFNDDFHPMGLKSVQKSPKHTKIQGNIPP